MSRREQPKRASRAVVEERMSELLSLRAELAAQGKDLSVDQVMSRFDLSRRQAHRYLQKLDHEDLGSLNPKIGEVVAHSFLQSLPVVNDVLRSDLEALNGMTGESENERMALIKARREQALAITRLGGQFLKELRELGLLTKSANGARNTPTAETESAHESEALHQEIFEIAERELLEFEKELEKAG